MGKGSGPPKSARVADVGPRPQAYLRIRRSHPERLPCTARSTSSSQPNPIAAVARPPTRPVWPRRSAARSPRSERGARPALQRTAPLRALPRERTPLSRSPTSRISPRPVIVPRPDAFPARPGPLPGGARDIAGAAARSLYRTPRAAPPRSPASAGKNDSIASSATVTSSAVPNVASVLNSRSSCAERPQPQRRDEQRPGRPRRRRRAPGAGSRAAPRAARRRRDRARARPGAASRVMQVRAVLVEVGDPRREAVRVQADAQRVRPAARAAPGATPSVRIASAGAFADTRSQRRFDDHRRVRRVAGEDLLQRGAHGRHLLGVERRLAVRGRVARGQQQRVALAQRHVEVLGEVQHQLAARLGAARLDEAEVARGHGGVERHVELAQPAAAAPVAQQVPDAGEGRHGGGHATTVAPAGRRSLTWEVMAAVP